MKISWDEKTLLHVWATDMVDFRKSDFLKKLFGFIFDFVKNLLGPPPPFKRSKENGWNYREVLSLLGSLQHWQQSEQ